MPAEFSWQIPQRVIRVYVHDDVTVGILQQMALDAHEMIEAGHAPVHIILDDAEATSPLVRIADIKAAIRFARVDLKKIGWVVGVGDTVLVAKMVFPMFAAILRTQYRRVGTMNEAMALLYAVDRSLKAAPATNS